MKQPMLCTFRRFSALLLILLMLMGTVLSGCSSKEEVLAPTTDVPDAASMLREKLQLLKDQVFTEAILKKLGDSPAEEAGFVVFLSLCNGNQRASVLSGTGESLEAAWNAAAEKASAFTDQEKLLPLWIKADTVYSVDRISPKELKNEVSSYRPEFFRRGLAFDPGFELALLEEELNGAKIYDYENGGLDWEYLNRYLEKADRSKPEGVPDAYTLFKCMGWFCDESNQVYALERGRLTKGHRKVEAIDDAFVHELIMNGSEFLMDQVKEDGSFIYGYYPRFDNELSSYNILRHVSTIWSLLCRYRIAPDENLKAQIDKTIQYAVESIIFQDENTAFLLEEKSQEIKLGGNGVAIVALTEYMDVFGTDKYQDLCCKLGNGILKMMDPEKGTYVHVWNADFTLKEEFRTVYYDGEATFALSRLYGLTKDQKWLDAACKAVDHFIRDDYIQYRDHWIAYAMNEITKHIPDNQKYYDFAMANANENLDAIMDRETTYHTYLELLMSSFETYQRMIKNGYTSKNIDIDKLLHTIEVRVKRQLEGYFFPEYAMYMENPQRTLNTFMVRHDGYRVRIDDVQHNIGGMYLFYKNYSQLKALGYPVDWEK